MTDAEATARAKAAKSRNASLVCAGAAALWVLAQWLGPVLGLPGQYAILIDLAALAAFVWAMVVTFRIWRKPPAKQGQPKQGQPKQGQPKQGQSKQG